MRRAFPLFLLLLLLFPVRGGAACAHARLREETVKAPTCTEEGLLRRTCEDCGEVFEETLPAAGHSEKGLFGKAPTCTENGNTPLYYCHVCGALLKAPKSLPALGHDFGEQITVPATWASPGETYRLCKNCGLKESTPIPKRTHLPASECPDGDVDMDGAATAADARLVLRAAVGFSDGLDEEQKRRADLDGDKAVTAADARGALRIAVGMDPFAPDLPKGYVFLGYTPKGIALAQKDGVTYAVTQWGFILLANKTYSLPASYAPGGLTPECSAAFDRLVYAAAREGLNIYLSSGYRSYSTQYGLYHRYGARDGYAAADTYSARPGHSEHQTGLALDVNTITASFAYTREGRWLAAHAHEYGFIIRYPADKTAVTGYIYEPWHIRYLGTEMAKAVFASGLCLEEFLGITSRYE